MYKQFALTIAISVLLSAFNALSLTPALCAMLLKPHQADAGAAREVLRRLQQSVRPHHQRLRRASRDPGATVDPDDRRSSPWWSSAPAFSAARSPPDSSPRRTRESSASTSSSRPAASLERTSEVLEQVEQILAKTEGVESYQTIGGYGVVTNTYQPNFGTIFVRLKPWEERHERGAEGEGHHGDAAAAVRRHSRGDRLPVQHPDDLRLRRLGGIQFPAAGSQRHDDACSSSASRRESSWPRRASGRSWQLFTSFDPNYPQVKVELDREKARTLGVPVNEVFQAMSAALGGSYVNDFNRFGRLYPRLRAGGGRLPAEARGHRRDLRAQPRPPTR